jgi:hypothetical protein
MTGHATRMGHSTDFALPWKITYREKIKGVLQEVCHGCVVAAGKPFGVCFSHLLYER